MQKPISSFAIALTLLGNLATVPLAHSQPTQHVVFEEDLATGFAQLTEGMPRNEVLALMKKEPSRKEYTNHLGLEIVRLVWTQWGTGSTFQVVLVAGRLVSKAAEKKSWIG